MNIWLPGWVNAVPVALHLGGDMGEGKGDQEYLTAGTGLGVCVNRSQDVTVL